MTTREITPRLDRQITREVTTTVTTQGGADYTWAMRRTVAPSGTPGAGQWYRATDRQLYFAASPTTGGAFPFDLVATISGVEVSLDGGAVTTLTVTTITIERHPFTNLPIAYTLDFGGDLPDLPLPDSPFLQTLTIRLPSGMAMEVTTTTEVKLWAERRDFSGRDFSQVQQGGLITVRDTRYVVRRESGPWAAGDTFLDEDGVTLTVQGVQQIGRAYLELLARSGGL